MFGYMGGYGQGGFFSLGHGFGGISQLVLFIGIGLVIYILLRKINHLNRGESNLSANDQRESNRPVEIAKLRYAKGEISLDEYQEIVNNLKQ